MIFKVENNAAFKKMCQEAWIENTKFWDENRIVHSSIYDYILSHINPFFNIGIVPKIIDFGCGNAWIYKMLAKHYNTFNYTGVDLNPIIIKLLKKNIKDLKANFLCSDIELPLDNELSQGTEFDIAICCLSLIEVPSLNNSFHNIGKFLKDKGILIIITLNPIIELIRLSNNNGLIHKDFQEFRNSEDIFYYSKPIISNGKISNRNYYGLLHPMEHYFSYAKLNNFELIDFKELNRYNLNEPDSTIYQGLIFKNNGK